MTDDAASDAADATASTDGVAADATTGTDAPVILTAPASSTAATVSVASTTTVIPEAAPIASAAAAGVEPDASAAAAAVDSASTPSTPVLGGVDIPAGMAVVTDDLASGPASAPVADLAPVAGAPATSPASQGYEETPLTSPVIPGAPLEDHVPTDVLASVTVLDATPATSPAPQVSRPLTADVIARAAAPAEEALAAHRPDEAPAQAHARASVSAEAPAAVNASGSQAAAAPLPATAAAAAVSRVTASTPTQVMAGTPSEAGAPTAPVEATAAPASAAGAAMEASTDSAGNTPQDDASSPTAGPAPLPGSVTSQVITGPAGITMPVPARAIPEVAAGMAQTGGGSVSLALHPDDLGTVVLTVSRSHAGVTVTMRGSAEAVAAVSRTSIVESLTSRGLSVVKVDLVLATPASGQPSATRDDRSSDQGSRSQAGASAFDGQPSGRRQQGKDSDSDSPFEYWAQ